MAKKKLIVVGDRVLVKPQEGEERSKVGLYLPPMIWAVQYRYSADALLLVFASEPYDAGDYIRDYDEFLSAMGGRDQSTTVTEKR